VTKTRATGKRPPPERSLCGAKKRQGDGVCRHPAGWGTSHPGFGRCKAHGGSTRNGVTHAELLARERALETDVDKPYDELIREKDIADLLRVLKQRSDITDLSEDLQLARAITIDFVNRARELETALLRWSASWDRDWQAAALMLIEELQIAQLDEDWPRYAELLTKIPDPLRFMDRPKKVVDVSAAVGMFRNIAAIVAQIVQMQQSGSVPVRDVEVLLVEIASATERAIRQQVGDSGTRDRLLEAIERAYAALRIQSWDADLLDASRTARGIEGGGALN
jgi:hypothetical protein